MFQSVANVIQLAISEEYWPILPKINISRYYEL